MIKTRLARSRRVDTIGEMKTGTRLPVVAGAFYPAGRAPLADAVDTLLGENSDWRCAPLAAPCGLIAPHAGYPYSGPTAASGYRAVSAQGRPELVVLLGANHTGLGGPVALDDHEAWRTPLGDVPVASDVVDALAGAGISVDRAPFVREHSLEVQLPFLQVLWGDAFRVVPICIHLADRETLAAAGCAIADVIGEIPSTLVVTSSDFTHYEPEEIARRTDNEALDTILALDADRFLDLCVGRRLSICGAGAIATLMGLASELDMTATKLVDYSTSADATGDRSSVVGYAAVSFLREDHG